MKVQNTFDADKIMRQVKAAMGLYANTASKKLEAEAKFNAPWQDRTGYARNSILGEHLWDKDFLSIIISGNVNYFVYLELAHEKKYSILVPTIEKNANEIIKGFQKLVE